MGILYIASLMKVCINTLIWQKKNVLSSRSDTLATVMEGNVAGSCLCKGVQYYVPDKPLQWFRCHCSMCRKAIGSEHCTFIAVNDTNLEYKSKKTLKEFQSSEHVVRAFCSTCGCSISMKYDSEVDLIWFNAATLDVDLPVVDPHQVYLKDRVPYLDIMSQAPSAIDQSMCADKDL